MLMSPRIVAGRSAAPDCDPLRPLLRIQPDRPQAGTWRIRPQYDQEERWTYVEHCDFQIPKQGWKLHLSATCLDAERVLEAILPVLFAEPLAFKLTSTLSVLEWLNTGSGGLSQMGKFVTVYPGSDQQAVALAATLHKATADRGLRGVRVPSDRPLMPDSLVHYRFGAFRSQWIRTPIGEWQPAVCDPTGELVPDNRTTVYSVPSWVTDPFVAAGIAVAPAPAAQVLAGRYVLVAMMHYSPRGTLHLALDTQSAMTCVVKTARPHAALDRSGRDTRDRLAHEAHMLRVLDPVPAIPRLIDFAQDQPFLVMEDLAGETLEHWASRQRADRSLPAEKVLGIARQLVRILAAMHDRNVVYRDLKSSNIVLAPDGGVRLLDLELAHELGSGAIPFNGGTRGYMSPNQVANGRPAFGDDIYAFGAILYYLATGCEPSRAPDASNLLTRPVELLNPDTIPGLPQLIARCLCARPGRPTAREILSALTELRSQARPTTRSPGRPAEGPREDGYHVLARRLGDGLCATARPGEDGRLCWLSPHPLAAGRPSWDLNVGSAGTLLALAELTARLGVPHHRDVLAQVAADEASSPRWRREHGLTGLYVGEAGPALALLTAGRVLGDDTLIAAAAERSSWVAAQPHRSPDMFNGTAGRVRFHLRMWAATGDPGELSAAETGGRHLLAAAESDAGTLSWTIPPGYGSLSGVAHTGYAHGAAGIADALLDLYEATGQPVYLDAAAAGGRWLVRLASVTAEGLSMPVSPGQAPGGAAWCRGTAGLGQFLLHAARLNALPQAGRLARAAADATAATGRGGTPTVCHGLAGSIDLLVETSKQFDPRRWAGALTELASLLQAFLCLGPGGLACRGEDPDLPTPDLMVGAAGVALSFLSLSDLTTSTDHPPTGPREGGAA
jgi:hypothetical protein